MTQAKNKVWAVVPAAGIGQRFNSALPKQYARLAGKTVIQHTLEALIEADIFAGIYIPITEHDIHFGHLDIASNALIHSLLGGKTRAHSVLNGLQKMAVHADAQDWVLVHDAARPLILPAVIKKLYVAVKDEPVGGVLVKPIYDTLKQLVQNQKIDVDTKNSVDIFQTLDRTVIVAAQTPQMFRYGLLRDALLQSVDDVKKISKLTDEASALEMAGYSCKAVVNPSHNLKITTAQDLQLAEYYMQQRT